MQKAFQTDDPLFNISPSGFMQLKIIIETADEEMLKSGLTTQTYEEHHILAAFFLACSLNKVANVGVFLEHDPVLCLCQCQAGENVFHLVTRTAPEEDSLQLLTVLCECAKKLSVEDCLNKIDSKSCSPLYYAVTLEKNRFVELLIEAGADCNLKNGSDGMTALHASCCLSSGAVDNLRLLLASDGADLSQTDTAGRTSLFIAVYHCNVNCVKLLIAKGAAVFAKLSHKVQVWSTKDQRNVWSVKWHRVNVLQEACKTSNAAMIEYLLSTSEAVQMVTESGLTAALNCIKRNSLPSLRLVLEFGLILGDEACTSCLYEVAVSLENLEIIRLLDSHGLRKRRLKDGDKRSLTYLSCRKGYLGTNWLGYILSTCCRGPPDDLLVEEPYSVAKMKSEVKDSVKLCCGMCIVDNVKLLLETESKFIFSAFNDLLVTDLTRCYVDDLYRKGLYGDFCKVLRLTLNVCRGVPQAKQAMQGAIGSAHTLAAQMLYFAAVPFFPRGSLSDIAMFGALETVGCFYDVAKTSSLIESWFGLVPRLSHLCRRTIRENMNTAVSHSSLSQLLVPVGLADYILMPEWDEIIQNAEMQDSQRKAP